ncbi:hypothetical protein [Duganella vulcania]|uniref:Uncharacterized protein n=1 Tax=Duganella vulcania TaxID=2692166 RepID=A0A845H2K1_9BURK|nr:hypothetical protein [Duganella vulcania]MYM98899.1 hypothetical protein [Duganella vulcania]
MRIDTMASSRHASGFSSNTPGAILPAPDPDAEAGPGRRRILGRKAAADFRAL